MLALFKNGKSRAAARSSEDERDLRLPEEEIGRILAAAREKRGVTLEQASQALRIRHFYLQAIEKGNFERLPGQAYTIGFLRTYASYLNLDAQRLVDRLKSGNEAPNEESQLYFPTPETENRIPGAALFFVGALIAVTAYGGWYYLSSKDSNGLDLVPELPDRLAKAVGIDQDDDGEAKDVDSDLPAPPQGELTAEEPETVPEQIAPDAVEPEAPEPETATPEVSEAPEPVAEEALAEEPFAQETAPEAVPETVPEELIEEAPLVVEAAPEEIMAEASEVTSETTDAAALNPLLAELPAEPEVEVALPSLLPDAPLESPEPETALLPASPPEAEEELAGQTAGSDTALAAAEIPAVPGENGDLASLLQPEPRIYGEENQDARVVVQASQDSWVQVRAADGELLLTRVMRPGDRYLVPNQEGISMVTGNAGGVDIVLDGRKLPALGDIGQVRHDIPLDPDALLAGEASVD